MGLIDGWYQERAMKATTWSSLSSKSNPLALHQSMVAGLSTLRLWREWMPLPVITVRHATSRPFTFFVRTRSLSKWGEEYACRTPLAACW